MEVLTRQTCPICLGKYGWSYQSGPGVVAWVHCPCTDLNNPAGAGFEVAWVKIPVTPTP